MTVVLSEINLPGLIIEEFYNELRAQGEKTMLKMETNPY